MTIQRLEIHGYRSFEKAVWEPGNLNLLVGPNGSGKSKLLRLLELISNVARGKLAESINAAGGMVPLLWNQEAKSLGWELTWKRAYGADDTPKMPLIFRLDLHQMGGGSGYRIAHDSLFASNEDPPVGFQREHGRESHLYRGGGDHEKVDPDDFDENESLLGQIDASPGRSDTPTRFRITRTICDWRIDTEIEVGLGSEMRQPAITQPSTRVSRFGTNLATVLHTLYTSDRDFKREINDGMTAAFGDEFVELVFQPASAQRIQLAVQWRSCRHPHAGQELSDGTLRFLFLLTVLADPNPAPLIAIDEPETGLHPSMFPIVAEYAAAAAERTQIVFSSHSAEFLDAFTEHAPHVTVCHWEDGRTQLYSLGPETLEKWLKAYRLGNLFTSGDLDALTGPRVDIDDDRFAGLPPEDTPLPPGSTDPKGVARG